MWLLKLGRFMPYRLRMLLVPLMQKGLPKLGLWLLTFLPKLLVAVRTLRAMRLRLAAKLDVWRV